MFLNLQANMFKYTIYVCELSVYWFLNQINDRLRQTISMADEMEEPEDGTCAGSRTDAKAILTFLLKRLSALDRRERNFASQIFGSIFSKVILTIILTILPP